MNQQNQIPFEDRYIVQRILANQKEGCYIYLALDVITEQPVVLKAVDTSYKNVVNSLQDEFQIHSYFSHPNIIKVLSTNLHTQCILSIPYNSSAQNTGYSPELPPQKMTVDCYVMEYAEGGDMLELLMSNRGGFQQLELKVYRSIILKVISAMEYIHERGYCHRDIKTENIFIDGEGNVKLADFGFSVQLKRDLTQTLGTDFYMAPEILLNRNNHQLVPYKGEKIDIFSLGVTIFTLVFKTMPFISANPYRDKYYKYIDMKKYDQFWSIYSRNIHQYLRKEDQLEIENLKLLLQQVLARDPEERPSLKQLRQSEFFQGEVFSDEDLQFQLKIIVQQQF